MKVIVARNVHAALAHGINLLQFDGRPRESRDGDVLVAPYPVTTVYERPRERVLFWPERDANPFFHLFESLWMLAGRNDLEPLKRYVKTFDRFSDDGATLHGAYGHRWRSAFSPHVRDQLAIIADTLQRNPNDRRCVLQMWEADWDLGGTGKDVPCNTTATFQIGVDGALHLTVFCRSNDIVMGAYGANAVHFSILLEYMAAWIGVPVGTYTQISVNYHAYTRDFNKVAGIPKQAFNIYQAPPRTVACPYYLNQVAPLPMVDTSIEDFDARLHEFMVQDTTGYTHMPSTDDSPFWHMVYTMFRAHHAYRTLPAPAKYYESAQILALMSDRIDWIRAGSEWIGRRMAKSGDPVQA